MEKFFIYKMNPEPLDLILFRGSDVISRTVEEAEQIGIGLSDYSHVGVIISGEMLPNIKELKKDVLYVWESTVNKNRYGVQIRELNTVTEKYVGDIYLAKLITNPWNFEVSLRSEIINKLIQFHEIFGRRTYEFSLFNLLATIIPKLRWLRNEYDKISDFFTSGVRIGMEECKKEWLFCSELVVLLYKNLGIYPPEIDERDIAPVDFTGIRYPELNIFKDFVPMRRTR